jgi:hypothetical protein
MTDRSEDLQRRAETTSDSGVDTRQEAEPVELLIGGLRFGVTFREVGAAPGATLRVVAPVQDGWKEVLRFDDFVDAPHFHAPADGDSIRFDPANGEPLEWYLAEIRDHLDYWLTTAGYPEVARAVDHDAIAAEIDRLRTAMYDCVPSGFERVRGVGLRRRP